jgi:sec-independent protein translocase protein TatB
MFGIGLPELAVIAFFGVVLLGPDKLPGLAKQLAHGIKAAKRMGDSVRDDLRSSLGDDYADLELRDLNPRELVRRQVMEALAERDDEDELDDESVEEIVDEVLTTPATPDERKTA